MRTITSPCAGLDQCDYRPSHDDRCDRPTASHSTMCEDHADRDYAGWYDHHTLDDCCREHCPGGETHHA